MNQHIYALPSSWIAPNTRSTLSRGERPKIADLDPPTTRQVPCYGIEKHTDCQSDVVVRQMLLASADSLNKSFAW